VQRDDGTLWRTQFLSASLYRRADRVARALADTTGTLLFSGVAPGRYLIVVVTGSLNGLPDSGFVDVRSDRVTAYRATMRVDLSTCQRIANGKGKVTYNCM
jgi:hypothetical protein